jgi:hypothetical protein
LSWTHPLHDVLELVPLPHAASLDAFEFPLSLPQAPTVAAKTKPPRNALSIFISFDPPFGNTGAYEAP